MIQNSIKTAVEETDASVNHKKTMDNGQFQEIKYMNRLEKWLIWLEAQIKENSMQKMVCENMHGDWRPQARF